MKITQISVFLENKKGRLYEVCALLGRHQINIRALNIAETPDYGVLRMVVDQPDEAIRVLKERNIIASRTDVVAVEISDRPGGLADILKVLEGSDVNVEYMYGFFEKGPDKAVIVFRFDRPEDAIRLLKKHRIPVVQSADIGR